MILSIEIFTKNRARKYVAQDDKEKKNAKKWNAVEDLIFPHVEGRRIEHLEIN